MNVHGLLMLADRNTYSRTSSAWAKCLWAWDVYWKVKKTQITRSDWMRAEFIKAACRRICSYLPTY